jgi:hypothetical protein
LQVEKKDNSLKDLFSEFVSSKIFFCNIKVNA